MQLRPPIPGLGGLLTAAQSIARSALDLGAEAVGGTPARRTSRQDSRHWIEVRGLAGTDADAIAKEVLTAIWAVPGVLDAVVNTAVARVIVTVGPDGASEDLARVVEAAEERARSAPVSTRHRAHTLPGDDEVLLARTIGAAAATVGLGLSVAGQVMRVPRLPELVAVIPTIADHVPAVRKQLDRRLGHEGADLFFSVANSVTAALTVSPTSAAAELVSGRCSRPKHGMPAWRGSDMSHTVRSPSGRPSADSRRYRVRRRSR